MSDHSRIEWTMATWNPVTGCTKVSDGCAHCYAERLAVRLQRMGNPKYHSGFEVTLHPDSLRAPVRWTRPRSIFVNSMSDLFHEKVPKEFIEAVVETMRSTPQHSYQILTKRADRLLEVSRGLKWPNNAWIGVTVESRVVTDRIAILREVEAAVRFVSFEPLLSDLPNLDLDGVDWAIVGGESGPGARPMSGDWARHIRDECTRSGTAFFFKQWGGVRKNAAGRILDGRTWDEMPQSLGRLTQSASAT